jgi:hypothetical protein
LHPGDVGDGDAHLRLRYEIEAAKAMPANRNVGVTQILGVHSSSTIAKGAN